MKEKILKLIQNREAFETALSQCDTDELKTEFIDAVKAVVEEKFTNLPSYITEQVKELEGLTENIKLEGDTQEWSDLGTKVFGEWNEDSAKLTVIGVLENGGTTEDLDKPLTYGEMLKLDETHPLYNTPSYMTTKEHTKIALEGKQPHRTLAETIVYSRLADLSIEAKKWEDDQTLWLTTEDGKELKVTDEDYKELFTKFGVEQAIGYYESNKKFTTSEVTEESIKELLNSVIEFPLVVTDKKLAELYMQAEFSTVDYLAPLVGVVRSAKVSEEDYSNLSKKYSILGRTALESLLKKSFEEKTPVAPISQPYLEDSTEEVILPSSVLDEFGRRTTTKKGKN